MFLNMFKGRNQYGFPLIVFSFASFFILSGLSSVSDVKSAHEKPRKKFMMDQKVAWDSIKISCCTRKINESEPVAERVVVYDSVNDANVSEIESGSDSVFSDDADTDLPYTPVPQREANEVTPVLEREANEVTPVLERVLNETSTALR